MKLLLISQYFPPEIGAGATRSESLVRYLREKGWEIEVLAELPNYPTGIVPQNYKHIFHQEEEYCGAIIHRLWVWANNRSSNTKKLRLFLTYLFSSLSYIILHPKRYDLVYASSPPIFAGIAGCLIAKVLQTKFVLEIRDIWPDAAVDIGSVDRRSLMFKISKKVEKWLYSQTDLIIPVTEASREIIEKRAPGKQTKVISNGVDLEVFQPVPNAKNILNEPLLDPTKFRVGYVGSLGVIHDMRTLVKAAKFCEDDPDIEFVIIGDGGQRQIFLDVIQREKPHNVIWLGLKKHELIPAYISSFDLAVNPVYGYDIFESIITVKFYEYLACGVPVISTSRGLLKKESELSEAAIAVEPENPLRLAEEIKKLKKNPQLLGEMSSKASTYIKSFSRRELAHQLSDTLTKFSQ